MRSIALAISIMAINVGAAIGHSEHPTREEVGKLALEQEHQCYHLRQSIKAYISNSFTEDYFLKRNHEYVRDLSAIYDNFCK